MPSKKKKIKKAWKYENHIIKEKVEHTRTRIWDNAEKKKGTLRCESIQIVQNE